MLQQELSSLRMVRSSRTDLRRKCSINPGNIHQIIAKGPDEEALVFYGYLNELPEDELLSGNYSHEKIKKGLKMVAEHYGILNVIDLIYR